MNDPLYLPTCKDYFEKCKLKIASYKHLKNLFYYKFPLETIEKLQFSFKYCNRFARDCMFLGERPKVETVYGTCCNIGYPFFKTNSTERCGDVGCTDTRGGPAHTYCEMIVDWDSV
uniref:Metalloprotease n=1 Tax=Caenorhabditis tropicalis TaxID=1561998 RepID=A0A1I7V2A3_9PELO